MDGSFLLEVSLKFKARKWQRVRLEQGHVKLLQMKRDVSGLDGDFLQFVRSEPFLYLHQEEET